MALASDQQVQINELKSNVKALQDQAANPTPQLITQDQLDANVADLTAANAALKALVVPPSA
jgi:hypothetical protein